jgi:hypothetical protein
LEKAMTDAPANSSAAPRDREGGLFGLVGAGIALVSLGLAPPWPAADASEAAIRGYFSEHGSGFLLQITVLSLGFVVLLRLYAGLARAVARGGAEGLGWTALAGAATMTVAIIVGNAPWAVLAYRLPSDGGLLLSLWDLGLFSAFTVAGPCIAALWIPLGLGVLRTGALPAGYGYALLGAAAVHVGASACVARSGVFSPNGPIALLSILAHVAVTIAGAVLLLRRGGAPRAQPSGTS